MFMLIWLPPVWLMALPANYVIDYFVTYLTMKKLNIKEAKIKTKLVIKKIWMFGFLADMMVSILLFNITILDLDKIIDMDRKLWYSITNSISYNPTKNTYAFFIVLLAILLAGVLIYFFNYKISLRKLDVSDTEKKKIALSLAIFTMPYVLLMKTPM